MSTIESEIRKEYEILTKKLIEKGLTLTTMESCTAGQIISLVTDTEGSSAVVKGAYVTYCNEAKMMQGVSKDVIDTFGVYSKETAKAMAEACRENYKSNIGIGVTGTFGNVDPNNADSVTNQVYFAIDVDGQVSVFERKLAAQSTRYEYKMVIAKEIVEVLHELIK